MGIGEMSDVSSCRFEVTVEVIGRGCALTCRPGSRRRSAARAGGPRTWRPPRPSSGSARFDEKPGRVWRCRGSVRSRSRGGQVTFDRRGVSRQRVFRALTSSFAGATWSRSTSILREAPLMSAIRRSVARSRVEGADNNQPRVAQSAGFIGAGVRPKIDSKIKV